MSEIDERELTFETTQEAMDDPNYYNLLYLGCNYNISIVRNLAVVLFLVAIVAAVWILAAIL